MANNPVIRKIKIADVVYDLKDGSVEEQIGAAVADIDHPVYVAEESIDTSAEVINADTLGGHPADDFATKVYVDDKISEAQVGGGAGGVVNQVQADWEQTDETQPDYIKNRTHYSRGFVEKEILAETASVTCCWEYNTVIPD